MYLRIRRNIIQAYSNEPLKVIEGYNNIEHEGEINNYSTYENGQVVTPTQAEIDIIEAEALAQQEIENKFNYIKRVGLYKYSIEYLLQYSTIEQLTEYREFAVLANIAWENGTSETYERNVLTDIIDEWNTNNPDDEIVYNENTEIFELAELVIINNLTL